MHPNDNIIQRALSLRDHLWLSFIADGVHIPFPTLGNYLRACGLDRAIIVTDAIAMTATQMKPGAHSVGSAGVTLGTDRVARTPDGSQFAGGVITMEQSAANLAAYLDLSEGQALRLTSANPRQAIASLAG